MPANAYGLPKLFCVAQGSEFVSRDQDLWAYQRRVTLDFSRPGKPTDNAVIEALNRRLQQECLNASWLLSMADARARMETRMIDDNQNRPHARLGSLTPEAFAARLNEAQGFAQRAGQIRGWV